MNLKTLQSLIDKAINTEPPEFLLDYGQYYEPYYHLMYLLAKEFKDGLAVELGVETGRASKALALGGINVIGIDHTRHDAIKHRIKEHNNFVFVEADSIPVPEIVQGKQISILHVDTEHTYDQPKNEFNAYKPFLIDRAIVLFDDLHAMENAVMYFFNELPYEKIEDDRLHSCGYGVMIYREDV